MVAIYLYSGIDIDSKRKELRTRLAYDILASHVPLGTPCHGRS
jgi:hypothetical protein